MSRENVDTARRNLAAWDRRDRDAWLADRHEESEILPGAIWPESGRIHGPEAAWDFYLQGGEAWEQPLMAEQAEVVDVDADRVLVNYRAEVRGRASGATTRFDFSVVVSFREGRIAQEQWFANRAEALEAVDLSE